ncbi:acyl carrier protein [Kitasatospora aureofaciens]|uniref:acyl carrier protein n=1 Tax=Kitasatospora aureofaciens TaxID=1894 RepID=UPI001C496715|nr:acyl carrier protein [Kitasatospora aureofaciens]MBV6698121.1 acyl carrier protein [Kitasatospora aureofaciens]
MTTQEAAAAPALDKEDLRATVAHALDVDVDELTDDVSFIADLGVDSLLALEVVVVLEKKYGLRLEERDFSQITSLGSAYALLRGKLGQA